jgi:phosphate-selective porin OprO/OprP
MSIRAAALLLLVPGLARAQETAAPAPEAVPTLETTPAPAVSPEVLARLATLEQQARLASSKETPVVSADEKGFGIASPDHAFELKLHGHLQIDARRHMDTSDPALADRDTIFPRRVRPILDATVFGLADLRIMPDFGNGTTALLDAYVDVHPRPWLRFRAGKFKPPIGLERLQNDANLPLPERALDSNLSAQRDVGLELWGDVLDAFVHYELAIFNGAPDNALTDVDTNHAKSYAGRVFLRPHQLGGLRRYGDLGVGVAVESGNERGTAANPALGAFRTAAQNTIYTYLVDAMDPTRTVFALKRHTRVNPQLYYYFGPVGLLAEWVKEYQELGKGAADGAVNHQGGHVTATFVIGGDSTYDGVRLRKPASWATKDVGAIEIGARFNWLDLDDISFQGSGLADQGKSVTKAQGFGLALNWWLNRNLKATGNWERTTFEGGNATGSGAARVITDRATENVVIGRLQVAF